MKDVPLRSRYNKHVMVPFPMPDKPIDANALKDWRSLKIRIINGAIYIEQTKGADVVMDGLRHGWLRKPWSEEQK